MIDINLLRNDIESLEKILKYRGFDLEVNFFNSLEEERKHIQIKTQELQQERNDLSKQVGVLKSQGKDASDVLNKVSNISAQSKEFELQLALIQEKLNNFLLLIPNVPHESVPLGPDETSNELVKEVGTLPGFDFEVKDHVDLGAPLGLDFDTAAKVSGSRFVFMKNDIARLHRAIGQFMIDTHTENHGYTEYYTPYLVNGDSLLGTGQLPKFGDDLFVTQKNEDESLYLIPTSEVSLTNTVRDEIIDAKHLPIRMTAHTPCFRSEAGSYGKDTRGMIRQHQFDKVEMVQITKPELSYEALEEMLSHAENILKALDLPYRVMTLSSGDMGFGAAKTYDIEVWLPSQQQYREISSISNCEDFQARRLKARFKNEEGKNTLVHTLNGSGLAVGRTLVAIMENNQKADGSINIPSALQPYMKNKTTISI
ncbi:seryl-tRNA synthetase [Methylophilales bacterium MBRSG12]|uniref:Serine--tRNA ligase n=1 Tax=Methylophilales bacterium MBRS-H7 TaxID=1623450 RepID=A0A0H4IZY3_9PROT|nr:seryl-tRNA synthetase [Methylophilales bacterium MBRSF5]AKO65340.1 seryl-tRNA synthetase [Methylophilales bacterium MBRS-H7]AKO66659.1 seryl-tRNA synthetase [Methylophilales bacterium MBRSG12]